MVWWCIFFFSWWSEHLSKLYWMHYSNDPLHYRVLSGSPLPANSTVCASAHQPRYYCCTEKPSVTAPSFTSCSGYLISNRQLRFRGNAVENRGYLFVYIYLSGRTYVILYFDPWVVVLTSKSTPSHIPLNRIVSFIYLHPYFPKCNCSVKSHRFTVVHFLFFQLVKVASYFGCAVLVIWLVS